MVDVNMMYITKIKVQEREFESGGVRQYIKELNVVNEDGERLSITLYSEDKDCLNI